MTPTARAPEALRLWLILMLVALLSACGTSRPADPVLPHASFTLQSKAVNELRRINVYTPPGYKDSNARYPVLYMPDGGIKEDFPHITNTIDKLIRENAIAPVLVVGIENTKRRRDLSGPTQVPSDREIAPVVGGSAAFRKFISDELIPHIERTYRCTDQRAIVGESAAGIFAVETLFLQPDLFDRYIAVDPALWWNNHELVRKAAARLPGLVHKPTRLWFAASDTSDIKPWSDQLAEILQSTAPGELQWTYQPMPQEKHHTIFRASKEQAFRWELWKS